MKTACDYTCVFRNNEEYSVDTCLPSKYDSEGLMERDMGKVINGEWARGVSAGNTGMMSWGDWMYIASERGYIICSILLIEFPSIPL